MTTTNDNFNGIQEYAERSGAEAQLDRPTGRVGYKGFLRRSEGHDVVRRPGGKLRRPGADIRQHDRQASRRGRKAERISHGRLPGTHESQTFGWSTPSMLYEEALQRQWSSATDVPWDTIRPLPDDIERAQCQLATFLTEVEFVAADVPGRWVAATSPDYFEPRMFLITQIMDESRHLDVFRKRALANGGGLMQRPNVTTSGVVGSIDLSRDFTEMSSRLHISGEGAVLTIFRMGELMAYNEAEKRIYRLAAQDESRHVAFGVMHMRYLAETEPGRKEEVHEYLDEGERALVAGNQNPAARDTAQGEALAVLLGGGKKNYDEGYRKLLAIRKRQAKEYVQRIRSAGFGERFENGRALPELMEYVRN